MQSKGNRTGSHKFSQVPSANIQRSSFDRSHGLKTTFNAGDLIPIFCDEALPGDTFSVSASLFGRLATPIHPIMDNLYLDTHFFAVPLRLVWDNFQKFMGEQEDPGDSTDFLIPVVTIQSGGFTEGNLYDYFGVPTKIDPLQVSALYGRAYNLIWNEWFRDQNLQDSEEVRTNDGPDTYTLTRLPLKRGKRHDYFTSCMPWPQKGPSVELPLGDTAPLAITGDGLPSFNIGVGEESTIRVDPSTVTEIQLDSGAGTVAWPMSWAQTKLEVDLSSATAATINEIRLAFQVQKMYERDARGGTRYTEVIRSHFNVVSPDQRLQRPEYLGGSSSAIRIQQVEQTAPSSGGDDELGTLAAYGIVTANSGHGFIKSFTEHCIVIGLVSVRADLNYQQGLQRQFSRQTRLDFFWPALAGLGEQAVLNKEIYADGTANDELVFGYQERYAEYRYKPSTITGLMRSNAGAPLDSWHLAQDFDNLPVLDAAFIEENPPMDRIIAVTNQPNMILDGFFKFKAVRPMPMYGVPGNMDRF